MCVVVILSLFDPTAVFCLFCLSGRARTVGGKLKPFFLFRGWMLSLFFKGCESVVARCLLGYGDDVETQQKLSNNSTHKALVFALFCSAFVWVVLFFCAFGRGTRTREL